jgi:predicted nucleic-acid-binding Zn-ribbon protein
MNNELPKLYSIIKCAKCGYVRRERCVWGDYGATDFTYKYINQQVSYYYGQLHIDSPEYMKVTCGNCKYSWGEACLNAEEE